MAELATFLIYLGILATLIVLTTLLSSILQQWMRDGRHNAGDEPRSADEKSTDTPNSPSHSGKSTLEGSIDAVANAIGAYHRKRDSHDYEQRKADKITVVILTITACFAAIAAIAGAISDWIFFAQLNEMRADGRPWIRIDAVEPSDLTWLPEKFRVSASGWGNMSPRITVSNVGKSPAFAVQAGAWGFVDQKAGGESALVRRRRVCSYFKSGAVPRGKILFPGQSASPSHDGLGTKGFGLFKEDIESADTITGPDGKSTFTLSVIGCADYLFGDPPKHHQTYFSFSVVRRVAMAGNIQGYEGRFHVGEDVPANDLVLIPAEAYNDAN